jgi:anaerobic selenocysteine-containing dehydrogenase
MTPIDSITVRTMCPMNCHPTLCGMLAEVKQGQLVSVKGDPDNPDSQGFLCVRGQASREIIGNPARLLYPLMRESRTEPLRRVSWDQALERIADSIAHAAPQQTAIWPGHGTYATNYGTRINAQVIARFANLHGSQFWNPAMICWGLGAFGLGLTGMLETNTKEDMGQHAQLIILWAANLASQPNTARHLMAAKRRGARVITIDVRHTEAAAKSDDVFLIRPGTDTALALAMMQVICTEQLHDAPFVAQHTLGFGQLVPHLQAYTPAWAEQVTGLAAERIIALARQYAQTKPAMIVLGGSSMHKGGNCWLAGRAIACLPGLTGNVGIAGGGFGPRHGSAAHGRGLADISAVARHAAAATFDATSATTSAPPSSPGVPRQMSALIAALRAGDVHNLLLMGSNMLSSFADSGAVADGLARTKLLVSYDLFLNDTARRFADVVLPGTAWLEELGCKMTHTHLYLMEPALAPEGEVRTLNQVMQGLATRLGLDGFFPWASDEALIDAILDHPCTGHASVASLRSRGGIGELNISHIANPNLQFDTESGKIEFYSAKALALGLPPLPCYRADEHNSHKEPSKDEGEAESQAENQAENQAGSRPVDSRYPLVLTHGRTLAHFHSFYNNGRALPSLAQREKEPQLWIAAPDASARKIEDGAAVRMFNAGGELLARAKVVERMAQGALWVRAGWPGLNRLTDAQAVLPDQAVDIFAFPAGQSSFTARVEVERVEVAKESTKPV